MTSAIVEAVTFHVDGFMNDYVGRDYTEEFAVEGRIFTETRVTLVTDKTDVEFTYHFTGDLKSVNLYGAVVSGHGKLVNVGAWELNVVDGKLVAVDTDGAHWMKTMKAGKAFRAMAQEVLAQDLGHLPLED